MKFKTKVGVFILGAMLLILSGCASDFKNIAPLPPEKYEKLGQVTGSACGSLVSPGGGTAYYILPIMLNSRVERAYEEALKGTSGATALIDVTLDEYWFWWILGTARCVTITGEAIR